MAKLRRNGDKSALVALGVGVALVISAIRAEWLNRCDTHSWWPLLIVVIGAGMISPKFITDLVLAWRKK